MADTLEQSSKKGPSMMVQVAVLAVMTIAALGIGWVSGSLLGGEVPPANPTASPAAPAAEEAEATPSDKKGKEEEPPANALVVNIPTITTNLAAPSDTWFRMELAVQLDQPSQDPALADTIQQDLMAFMRTVRLHQIEGASGFQHLKADLAERAAIRSDGHVKAVLIRTLIFE
jgi:flagellar protein FliL